MTQYDKQLHPDGYTTQETESNGKPFRTIEPNYMTMNDRIEWHCVRPWLVVCTAPHFAFFEDVLARGVFAKLK